MQQLERVYKQQAEALIRESKVLSDPNSVSIPDRHIVIELRNLLSKYPSPLPPIER